MENDRFSIVFVELSRAIADETWSEEEHPERLADYIEMEEIDALRRLVAATTEPRPACYTTT